MWVNVHFSPNIHKTCLSTVYAICQFHSKLFWRSKNIPWSLNEKKGTMRERNQSWRVYLMQRQNSRYFRPGLKDENLTKKQTYMKTETCKLHPRVFWTFRPNFIKTDPYNFELYCLVGAFLPLHASIAMERWCRRLTSVCLSVCLSVRDIGDSWSHTLR